MTEGRTPYTPEPAPVEAESEYDEDMANVGRALMEALSDNRKDPFLDGWMPADCPSEFVVDALNAMHDLRAENEALRAENEALRAERDALREALTDIGIYGCGMLNQPIAINGPEEDWLRKCIAQYEQVARAALRGEGRP